MTMPWNLARQTAREAVKPLEAVEVALADALGLALASGVRALASQPACDTSAMDGYAVAGSGPWTVVGRVAAGDPVPGATGAPVPGRAATGEPVPGMIRAGEAFGVATGAPVPGGADSVVPVEVCSVEGSRLHGEAVVGKHIRRRGEDWSAGDELVPAGSAVTPAVLGLAAGAGHDTLLVHRRPRVAVVVTGDELLHSGPPRPGRVRDAIGPMLPGLLAGADLLGTVHLRDDPSALTDALTSARADVLVTCGATSVGPADHLRRVLHELDADILVSGVACRPGHPMLLAALPDGRHVIGLPGNPFAALAAALTLLRPLLDTLGGHAIRPPITATLNAGAHSTDTRLIPVTRTGIPTGHDRPGSLWGAALADALAVIPPGHGAGEVELLPL
ncbi:molybdopterin molybdotransferase MoeA [Lentzea flava]|uniref:Molybdopterin molybdenumtransferase n=1 Tax=Lentzea flava TaxID=103732 RepID=A0ABQ2UDD8_9PSEU|nr:molybdopterin molybdotransferase MoeA [Lentzea flava]MCP2198045.1 molybdopterin molybdotransferase [Lentzea flava]GGU24289.1 molybdopterin molybdenumtransferase MoeA [Lentzea flava]